MARTGGEGQGQAGFVDGIANGKKRTCAGGSRYVPSRYNTCLPISNATLKQVAASVSRVALAGAKGFFREGMDEGGGQALSYL